MKVTKNDKAAAAILKKLREARKERPDTHTSDLLYCLRNSKHKKLHPEQWVEGGLYSEEDESTLILTMGEGHHQLLGGGTEEIKSRVWEGIKYTPDFLTEDADGVKRVVEYKTTRYSANKPIEEMSNYLEQLGAYCLFEGTRFGRLVVIHWEGDYKWVPDPITGKKQRPKPKMNVWDLEYTDTELAGWGRELKRRNRIFAAAKKWDDLPLEEAYAWKCEYCPLYKRICEGGKGEWTGAFQRFEFRKL